MADSKIRILVIDDHLDLTNMVRDVLEAQGYEVFAANSGERGLELAFTEHPHLILLDVMMPGMDGWETCQRLREMSDVAILMVTARGAEQDVVRGLTLGADDFVRKPFSLDELELRISAILRRTSGTTKQAAAAFYDDGNLKIDLDRRLVLRGGKQLHLTPTEFNLLTYLVKHADHVVAHEQLLTAVWGAEYADDTPVLSVYVRYLREKVEADPRRPVYIHNERGIGYRFARQEASSAQALRLL
jgi:two-component system KDP operon response regulator KdpE